MMTTQGAIDTTTTVELRMGAVAENVGLARLALSGVAATAGMSLDVVADLKLAVSETCTNAVLHAYPDGREGAEVVIRYTVCDDSLSVEVIDTGVGFDPAAVTPTPGRHEFESQMGLAIARAITDGLEIESRPSGGTRVVFSKRR
jgi:serine/threonine-protein kinase RsbW